jgi:hypothetical protein
LTVPSSETGGCPLAVPLADPDSDPDPDSAPDSRTLAPSSSPHAASTNTTATAGAARQLILLIARVYHPRDGLDFPRSWLSPPHVVDVAGWPVDVVGGSVVPGAFVTR